MRFLQAIFFDFDGVLVDSNALKTRGFQDLFAGCEPEQIEAILDHHRQNGGISRVDKIRYIYENILQKPLSEVALAAEAAKYSALVLDAVIAAPWIMGAEEFLRQHHRRLPLFLVSGTPDDELRVIIDRRGIRQYFREVCGSPVKKPEHIRRLLTTYQLDAELCVFVGDALTDYKSAFETGLHFIGIEGEVTFPAGTRVLPDCLELETALAGQFLFG